MTNIAVIRMGRRRTACRSGRLETRPGGDLRRGTAPLLGAILVLVFALAQGIFWAGIAATFVMGIGTAITVAAIATLTVSATGLAARIAATRSGYGSVALRGIEVAAAGVVLVFGVALLAGYMANERIIGAVRGPAIHCSRPRAQDGPVCRAQVCATGR